MIEVAKADYRCRFDCIESGCEGHTLSMKYDSEDRLLIVCDKSKHTTVYSPEYLKALISCLKELSDIPEIQEILDGTD